MLVGRGDPAARQRLAWAQGLATRWESHVLLMLATVSAEIELATMAGDARTAVDRAGWADRRLLELWGDDRLASVRLVASALAAVADAAAAARTTGDAVAVAGWVAEGHSLAEVGRTAASVHNPALGATGIEAHAWATRLEGELARLQGTSRRRRSCGGRRSSSSATGTCTSRRGRGSGWPRRCWRGMTGPAGSGGVPRAAAVG